MVTRFLKKASILFHRRRFRSELDEEMAFHREQSSRELIAAGMQAEDARSAAARRFGNPALLRERGQQAVGFSFETVMQDIRFSARQLRRSPGFAVMAVLILALGVGAGASIFAFVDAALIQPLPYPDPTRLVHVTEAEVGVSLVNLSYPDFVDWRRFNTTLASLDAFGGGQFSLATPAGAEDIRGGVVTAGFFRTLGVRPALGRDFRSGEDTGGTANVVMLSYPTWQRRFGARPDVIGKPVTLGGVAYTVIGVLPRDFEFALLGDAEVWAPLRPVGECMTDRSCHSLYAVGRLKEGVTVAAARAEMQQIARRLEAQYPDSNRGRGASVKLLSDQIVGDVRPILLVLLWGAALLLLIACINVANLLLVRSEGRRLEIAVRGALGASPARLRRQFVTEAVLLSLFGCIAGLGLAMGGMQVLRQLVSKDLLASLPSLNRIGVNEHLLLFVAALGGFAVLLFSVLPILHHQFANLRDGLAAGTRGATGSLWRRMGSNLVVIELATAMILLASAGLLGKSLYRLLHVDLGFPADHLAAITIGLPETGFEKDSEVIAYERELLRRVDALPGVQSAGITNLLPVICDCNTDWIRIPGRPYDGTHLTVLSRIVSASFFATLRTRLAEGNYFGDDADSSKPKVVVVNRAFANKFFPGESAVGKKFGDGELSPKSMVQIVGVIENVKDGSLTEEDQPTVYNPFNQTAPTYFSLLARTSQNSDSMLPTLGEAIHAVNRDAGLQASATMEDRIASSQPAYLHRVVAYLVGGFAAVALLLGAVGIYGIVAYSVSRRTREIGVRMALGAVRGNVYRLILREAGMLIALGIAFGAAGSVEAALLMRKLLFEVSAWDGPTLVAVSILLAGSALLASFVPARRAASVSPVEALRADG